MSAAEARRRPILRMIAGRLGIGVFTLFVISVLIFLAVSLLPGDDNITIKLRCFNSWY